MKYFKIKTIIYLYKWVPQLGRADKNREFCGSLYRLPYFSEQLMWAIPQEKLEGDGSKIPIGEWDYGQWVIEPKDLWWHEIF